MCLHPCKGASGMLNRSLNALKAFVIAFGFRWLTSGLVRTQPSVFALASFDHPDSSGSASPLVLLLGPLDFMKDLTVSRYAASTA